MTPDQGQRLALAQSAGTLSLALRTFDTVEDEPLEAIELRDLLNEPSEAARPKRTLTIRRAGAVEQVEIN